MLKLWTSVFGRSQTSRTGIRPGDPGSRGTSGNDDTFSAFDRFFPKRRYHILGPLAPPLAPLPVPVPETPRTQPPKVFKCAPPDGARAAGAASSVALLQTSTLTDLLDLIDTPCTVFFDLDETLLQRVHNGPRFVTVPTEGNAAEVVSALQSRPGVRVHGLTSRPYYKNGRYFAAHTAMELRELGFCMDRGPDGSDMLADPEHPGVGLYNGCAFTGAEITKGQLLVRLTQHTPIDRMVFVDDRVQNIRSVVRFAMQADIPCLAVHYRRALPPAERLEQCERWDELSALYAKQGARVIAPE